MNASHPYDNYSSSYNFFIHPFHNKNYVETGLSLLTNIFISVFTGGTWAIAALVLNIKDNNTLKIWKAKQNNSDKTIIKTDEQKRIINGKSQPNFEIATNIPYVIETNTNLDLLNQPSTGYLRLQFSKLRLVP